MKRTIVLVCIWSLCMTSAAYAGWFGETESERQVRLAKHVADVLREPNRVIAQAQEAVERNDIDEGVRLFRKAQKMLEQVEASEDTSGSAFATFRLKKFHCISMLDALVLRQSEVMDVRQAVTDTSDLAKRLAEERAALAREAEEEKKKEEKALPKPPTPADQLAVEEAKLTAARAQLTQARAAAQRAEAESKQAQERFTAVARAHTALDAQVFTAKHSVTQAKKEGKSAAVVEALTATANAAADELQKAKQELEAAKAQVAAAETAQKEAAERVKTAEKAVSEAECPVVVLRKAIADEAEAKRKKLAEEKAAAAAEKKRLEVERLKAKQAAAESAAKARAKAAKEAEKRDAALKAKAEADAKELKKEVQMCEELWKMKHVDALEKRVGEALVKWPEAAPLLVQLARLRLLQGEDDAALELVSMISEKGEVGKRAAFVAAGAYLVKGQPLNAMKILEPILEAYPKDPDVYYNMATVFVRLPEADPKREIASKYYIRSIELGGRRSVTLEQRLGMEE